jgi:hypothetical protein
MSGTCSFCGLEFRFLCALAIELHVDTCRPSSPPLKSCELKPCATVDEAIVDLTSPSEQTCAGQTNAHERDSCNDTDSPNDSSVSGSLGSLWSRLETRLISRDTEIQADGCLNFDTRGTSVSNTCGAPIHSQDGINSCNETDTTKVCSLSESLWSRLESRLIGIETPKIKTDGCSTSSALNFDTSGTATSKICLDSIHSRDVSSSMAEKATIISNVKARTKSVEKRAPLQRLDSSSGNVPRPNQVYAQKRPRNVVAPSVECAVGRTNLTADGILRMPDYSSMEVDQLKTLLHAYGIRPGQKRYMVDKLSEVWLRLQAASSAQTQDPDAQRKAEAEAERAELKKRQRSALQEERDKRTLVAAVEALRCHVLLYERILLMDSLSLDEVADALAEEGVRISMRLLSHLLNELGVPYTHGPPRCNKLLNAALAAPQAD